MLDKTDAYIRSQPRVSGESAQVPPSCHVLSQRDPDQPGCVLGMQLRKRVLSKSVLQVLGRNLEGTITKAEDIKKEWKDDFTSVEHLVLAMLDDARFGRKLLRDAGLDAGKLTQAIKDIRGGNRGARPGAGPSLFLCEGASSHARIPQML